VDNHLIDSYDSVRSEASSHLVDEEIEELINSIGLLGFDPFVDILSLVFWDSENTADLLGVLHGDSINVESTLDNFWFVLSNSLGLVVTIVIKVFRVFVNFLFLVLMECVLERSFDGLLDGIFFGDFLVVLVVHVLSEHLNTLLDEVTQVRLVLLITL